MSLRNPPGPAAGGNPYGDLELTDPQAMRALAHPVRLAILSRLQENGPATATELSAHVGASPSVTSWHLRHLARFGLVTDSDVGADRRKRHWEASARGFRFVLGDGEDGRAAGQVLSRAMFEQYAGLARRWLDSTEPVLEPEWRRQSGLSGTTLQLTVAELAEVISAMENVLAPYVTRDRASLGADRRRVRILCHVMPEGVDR